MTSSDSEKKSPFRKPTRRAGAKSKASPTIDFDTIRDEVEGRVKTETPKSREEAQLYETEVRGTTAGLTVEKVMADMASLGASVNQGLGGLTQQLVEKIELLDDLRNAVAIEQGELARLHKIDVALTTLDQLVAGYEAKKKDLDREIADERQKWTDEQTIHEAAALEKETLLKKQRARDAEEYEYQCNLARKKSEDTFSQKEKDQELKLKEREESLKKQWAERESLLKSKEDEYARMAKESATFSDRLKQEVDTAVLQTSQKLKSEHDHAVIILKKEWETERKVAELRIKVLEETVTRQFNEVADLQKRLDTAKSQVQDIAIKAIEGASGARALSHVSQIAMEQAKPRTSNP